MKMLLLFSPLKFLTTISWGCFFRFSDYSVRCLLHLPNQGEESCSSPLLSLPLLLCLFPCSLLSLPLTAHECVTGKLGVFLFSPASASGTERERGGQASLSLHPDQPNLTRKLSSLPLPTAFSTIRHPITPSSFYIASVFESFWLLSSFVTCETRQTREFPSRHCASKAILCVCVTRGFRRRDYRVERNSRIISHPFPDSCSLTFVLPSPFWGHHPLSQLRQVHVSLQPCVKMVQGGMSCIKYILFVFNFIFVVSSSIRTSLDNKHYTLACDRQGVKHGASLEEASCFADIFCHFSNSLLCLFLFLSCLTAVIWWSPHLFWSWNHSREANFPGLPRYPKYACHRKYRLPLFLLSFP